MKKLLVMIAVLTTISISNSFAQYGGYSKPSHPTTRNTYTDGNYSLEQLDRIVKLTKKQEIKIMNIEHKFDKLSARDRRDRRSGSSRERFEAEKQNEILSVLTPAQHRRLMAFEDSNGPRNTSRRYTYGR